MSSDDVSLTIFCLGLIKLATYDIISGNTAQLICSHFRHKGERDHWRKESLQDFLVVISINK